MLGRLFRWLGYVPVSSLNLMPGDAASPAVAPHRHRASAFEFDRAHLDNLCYSYSDGDFSYLAVGRDDWAPLAVAGFSLMSQPQCRAWLNENLRSRVWVGGEALESWHAENRPVFAKVVARPDRQFVAPINLAMVTDIGEKDQVPLLEASEIAELFALAWQRARVASPFFFLANSAQYAALLDHHALRFACEANEHALERAIAWLATWFEARGLAVDRERSLVNLPGYRALPSGSCIAMRWTQTWSDADVKTGRFPDGERPLFYRGPIIKAPRGATLARDDSGRRRAARR